MEIARRTRPPSAYPKPILSDSSFGHVLAVTAGRESGHPGNRHLNDTAQRNAASRLLEIYFWPGSLSRTERTYRPCEGR